MIITVKKYLFWGSKVSLERFFFEAQNLGFVEFTSEVQQVVHKSEESELLACAVKELAKYPTTIQGGKSSLECCPLFFAKEVTSLMLEKEKLLEEETLCHEEIAQVFPFGEFNFEDVVFIRNNIRKSFLFCYTKMNNLYKIIDIESIVYISSHHDFAYFIFCGDKKNFPENCYEIDVFRSLNEVNKRIQEIKERKEEIECFFRYSTVYLPFLRDKLIDCLDEAALKNAQGHVQHPLNKGLFFVEGWVPETCFKRLSQLVEPFPIFFEEISPNEGEKIPTYMKNTGFNQVGEDLVNVYDTPAPEDTDPSAWVFWAFLIFFAMIISDAGYGLFYLAFTLYLYQKSPNLKKRIFLLLGSLSAACIFWGILSGSLLGINFAPKSWANTFSIYPYLIEKKVTYHIQQKDATYRDWIQRYPNLRTAKGTKELVYTPVERNGQSDYPIFNQVKSTLFLEVSLMVGVLHIILALLRYVVSAPSNFGWILFVLGGYLYCPYVLSAPSFSQFFTPLSLSAAAELGEQFMWIGILFALVVAIMQRGLYGLEELTKVVQIFADILSYLRIYALALAGGIMAQTFNSMGVANGLFLGAMIIFTGHSINLLLATIGGVIHGLRLNFIEWYHYCFYGEGRLLQPLKKINTKQE